MAASFIGSAEDVEEVLPQCPGAWCVEAGLITPTLHDQVRSCLREYGNENIKVMAKVERPSALERIDEIIQASDAIMVARGLSTGSTSSLFFFPP